MDQKKDNFVVVRVSKELKERLLREARNAGVGLSEFIRGMIS